MKILRQAVDQLVGGDLVPTEFKESYFLAAWTARNDAGTRKVFGPMLRDEHLRLLESRQDSIDHRWASWISVLHGLYQHLESGKSEAAFGKTPRLQNWFPATAETELTQVDKLLPTHWRSRRVPLALCRSKLRHGVLHPARRQGSLEGPGRFGKTSPHRGRVAHRNLNLKEGLAGRIQGRIEKVFDLPEGFSYMGQPEWTYDGKSLVFHRHRPGEDTTGAIMGRLNLEIKELTGIGIGHGRMPCLAPDGEKLVFNRDGTGIMQSNADGTGEEVLDENGWAVGYSPDGKYIVWGNRNNCTLMDRSTGKRRLLLTPEQAAQISYMYWNISWSPNSKAIAFNAQLTVADAEVLIVTDIDSTDGFKILFKGNIQPDITWHPDSEQVVFAWADAPNSKRLYIMHRHNDSMPRLLPGQPRGFRIQDCDFSPDGKKIAFAALAPTQRVEWRPPTDTER